MFIQENASKIVVWKMAAILSRPQCDNSLASAVIVVRKQNYLASSINVDSVTDIIYGHQNLACFYGMSY